MSVLKSAGVGYDVIRLEIYRSFPLEWRGNPVRIFWQALSRESQIERRKLPSHGSEICHKEA